MNNKLLKELKDDYLALLENDDMDAFEYESPELIMYKAKISQLTEEEYGVFLDMIGEHDKELIRQFHEGGLKKMNGK